MINMEEFGFSKNESKIYLSLLEKGHTNPSEIARIASLNRSYLYDILGRMVDKGFLSKIKVKNKTHFQASPPRHVAELLTNRATEFQRILPQLEQVQTEHKGSSTELYEGSQVISSLLRDVLSRIKDKEEVRGIIADESKFANVSKTLFDQYFRQLRERQCTEYILTRKGAYRFEGLVGEYRELPTELIGDTSTLIYGDTVAEIIFSETPTMIITRNSTLVDSKTKLFNYFWKIGKRVK